MKVVYISNCYECPNKYYDKADWCHKLSDKCPNNGIHEKCPLVDAPPIYETLMKGRVEEKFTPWVPDEKLKQGIADGFS